MPIQSGQIGRYGIKATPDILGPHQGIPWRSPPLSNAIPTINGVTRDSTGAVLGSCTVWAMNAQTDAVMGSTTSDANGVFSLTLYRSGSFYIVSYKTAPVAAVPSQMTLSRPSSANYFNSSGVITTAISNNPRFDYKYNGSAWVAAGLLIEEQRTNILLQNGDLTNAAWAVAACTISNDASVTGLDGGIGQKLLMTAGTNSPGMFTNTPPAQTNGSTYTDTIYAHAGTSLIVYINIQDNGTGTNYHTSIFNVGATSDTLATETFTGGTGVSASASAVYLGNGWFRITTVGSVAGTLSGAYFIFGCAPFATGNTITTTGVPFFTSLGTEFAYFSRPQRELGSFPTSVIFTTAAGVTRSADILSSTDATLLAAKGWIVETGELPGSVAATLLGINTVIGLGATSGNALTTADGGAQTTANTGTWTSANRGGLAFDSTPRVSIDLNGGTVVTAANTPATPTALYFGNTNNGASGFLNGHLKAVAAYSAITDAQLPTLSTVRAGFAFNPTFSIDWVATDVSGTTVNTLIPT